MENKNKINERDICTNASNFGVQNSAVTLIALIITIIVLLILAGVTLNMVMGENGIFGKANNAKDKTEVAQYEEELRICVLELQADAATNGETFNMETIKNKFVEKVKELENTTEIEFPTGESETRLDGTYKGYEFYIDDKYAAHIGDKATGISLTTSLEPSGWTQGPVTATITIKSNNGINKVEPNEGSKNGNNEYIITKENIAENTSFEYTVTDGQGNTQTKIAVINTIDRLEPKDFTISAENTDEGLKIKGTTTDAESGIDKYEYYAKKSTDSDYTKYDSNPITGLANGTYSVYAVAYDKAKNYKKSNEINVKISIKFSDVSAGCNHSLAIDTNSHLWGWGYNTYGQLGDGTTKSCNEPKMISDSEFTQIFAGDECSYAIDKDGYLWSWGKNDQGQLGIGNKTNQYLPIKVSEDKTYKYISGKSQSAMAIDTNGKLYRWGEGAYRWDYTFATTCTSPQEILEDKTFKSACAARGAYLAIDSEDNLWAWGYGQFGQLGAGKGKYLEEPTLIKNIAGASEIKISLCLFGKNEIVLKSNGKLVAWGENSNGEFGIGDTNSNYIPSELENNHTFSKIDIGDTHCLGIDMEGKLWTWGNDSHGQLGDGKTSGNSLVPIEIMSDKNFKKISAGEEYSLAIDSEGYIWGWGNNGAGQIGNGTTRSVSIPIQI